MKVVSYSIPYKFGDVIKIKPYFDVHLGNAYCDKPAFIKYLKESDEHTYFMGGGDLLDSIIVTDPRYAKHVDDTARTAILDEQVDQAIEMLWPYRDRIIGLGRGNHEDVVIKKSGTDVIWRVCEKLDCEYLGYSGFVILKMRESNGRGRTVRIKWHHGWGGGSRTQGADITKYSKDTAYWDADLFLYGHVHKKQSDEIPRLGTIGKSVIAKNKLFAICGTFLKTYSATYDASYSEVKGYPPVAIGGLTVHIQPTHKWVKMWIQ